MSVCVHECESWDTGLPGAGAPCTSACTGGGSAARSPWERELLSGVLGLAPPARGCGGCWPPARPLRGQLGSQCDSGPAARSLPRPRDTARLVLPTGHGCPAAHGRPRGAAPPACCGGDGLASLSSRLRHSRVSGWSRCVQQGLPQSRGFLTITTSWPCPSPCSLQPSGPPFSSLGPPRAALFSWICAPTHHPHSAQGTPLCPGLSGSP